MDKFFVKKIKNIVDMEEDLKQMSIDDLDEETLRRYKKMGFSDKGMADILGVKPPEIYKLRVKYDIIPVYKMVDTCAGEFEAVTPYYYSTYDKEDEVL